MIRSLWAFLALVGVFAFGSTALGDPGASAGTDSLGISFSAIPAGEFLMGSGEECGTSVIRKTHPYSTVADGVGSSYEMRFKESPAHRVRLTRGFEIATTEVTVGQFRKFVEETGYESTVPEAGGAIVPTPDPEERPGILYLAQNPEADWRNPGFPQEEDHPVVCVSLRDAEAFCAWLSEKEGRVYRLPTESEWEYAARAGATTIYSGGNEPESVLAAGNLADGSFAEAYSDAMARQRVVPVAKRHDDGYVHTAPVGAFLPNSWSLHDMHGNVWEWTSDIYLEKEYQRRLDDEAVEEGESKIVVDPTGPETTDAQEHGDWRVIRGGSWNLAPLGCRSASRAYWYGEGGAAYIGFRVVRENP